MGPIERWPTADALTPLLPGEVHVWSVRLDRPGSSIELVTTLSGDERDRASRFHFERDRRRFICARGALRRILGEYLDVDASALTFTYGAHGKPALGGFVAEALSFNVSHSGELALIAVAAPNLEIGVDVEAVRPMPDGDDIASRYFAPAEVARLRALPVAMQEEAFFRCWTRKEAYLKALGDGLARPLDSFEVTLAADEPVELSVIGNPRESARWKLVSLEPAAGFAGALVGLRGVWSVKCRSWSQSHRFSAAAMTHEVRNAL